MLYLSNKAVCVCVQEHYEAVMRRTLERSNRVEQRQKRWSWGGLSDSENKNGMGACSKSQTWETPDVNLHLITFPSNSLNSPIAIEPLGYPCVLV